MTISKMDKFPVMRMCVPYVCKCACVRACVRACLFVCAFMCVPACVRVCPRVSDMRVFCACCFVYTRWAGLHEHRLSALAD